MAETMGVVNKRNAAPTASRRQSLGNYHIFQTGRSNSVIVYNYSQAL